MTIREIIHRVKASYARGVSTDDSSLRNRLVYSKIKSSYADLINDPRIPIRIDDFARVTIDCVQLIETTPYECDCVPPLGCKVYRSKYKLPTPIQNRGRLMFGPVRTIDGQKEFAILSNRQSAYSKYAKYASNLESVFIKNDYLYVIKSDGEEVVSITAVFQDPFDVAEFRTLCSECQPESLCISLLDQEFAMPAEIEDKVINKAIQELAEPLKRAIKDNENNSKEQANPPRN
jgi:hypothetical protein